MTDNPFIYSGYVVHIVPDTELSNPREDDNLGTMVCAHRRSTFGDIQVERGVLYFERKTATGGRHGRSYEIASWSDVRDAILDFHGPSIILPLYLYDHGGYALSTGIEASWYHAAWDAGQIGFIFVPLSKVRAEYGWKHVTKARRAQIEKYLEGEVETYESYINGDGYGLQIYDREGNEIHSIWGFYGYEQVTDSVNDYVPKEPAPGWDGVDTDIPEIEDAPWEED